ncbi:hypothetical protein [Corynebacterium qintianiae]|nr:hypothetical protein [Corynebacterium qintianiae]
MSDPLISVGHYVRIAEQLGVPDRLFVQELCHCGVRIADFVVPVR